MEDIYILQIETATPVCAVALSKNGETIATIDADEPNLHASHLTIFIEQVLAEADLAFADLAAIAVSMGPGSYTGLRIGVSTAKGLCYGLDIPLIGINTLDAMFFGFAQAHPSEIAEVAIPMIDARRMEVYMALYEKGGHKVVDTVARIIDVDAFYAEDGKMVDYVLFGTGADKFIPVFSERSDVRIYPDFKNSAGFLSASAFQRYEDGDFEDLVHFEPFYLKDFIATTPKKR